MKKYIGWIAGAVALVAIIAGATLLYDKFKSDFAPSGGGVVSLAPWEGFEEPTTPPEEIETPPVSETQPPESETQPPESETQPPESETQPPESETQPPESETQPPESETHPPESETQPPVTETEPPETTPEPPVETDPPKVTLKAPDFTVLDMNGNSVKLSDYTGKPIVINFWASWCTYCVQEMPDFEAMYKKYGDRVNFLMVNVEDASLSTVKSYVASKGYSFPVFFDSTGEAAHVYGASALPTTYFFDANGNAIYYAPGMLDGVTLENTIIDVMNR